VDVEVVPGDHESILREPYVARVAARLRALLARA
jgi:thioesterase domain-containing protein